MRTALAVTSMALMLLLCPGSARGQSDLDRLTAMMTGSFSSRAQAEADTNYFDIRLEMVSIWRHRGDGPWLYVEQASAARLERPYRQRVYRLARTPSGFRSDVYTLSEPLRFAGAWREPHPLAALTPDSLELRTGCTVFLEREADGAYAGSTRDRGCASTLRGASYATSEVRITPGAILSWDRGFDAGGDQVWGATQGGYVFRRVTRPSSGGSSPAAGRIFPTVSGSNLEGRDFVFPRDLSHRHNLMMIAFQRDQQALVDTWIPSVRELARERTDFQFYELPTISSRAGILQWVINQGMKRGIPDKRIRESTVTLYLDKEPFKKALGIPHEETIYVFLLDRSGREAWSSRGAMSAAGLRELRRLVAQQP